MNFAGKKAFVSPEIKRLSLKIDGIVGEKYKTKEEKSDFYLRPMLFQEISFLALLPLQVPSYKSLFNNEKTPNIRSFLCFLDLLKLLVFLFLACGFVFLVVESLQALL